MRAREALRPGVDWSQVAARECFDCGTDDLPGVFAELGRRARGEVRYEESDFWAPVREDVAWPGLSEAGAGCGCGGSCGSAACGGGEADEVDDFWAPVVEGRPPVHRPQEDGKQVRGGVLLSPHQRNLVERAPPRSPAARSKTLRDILSQFGVSSLEEARRLPVPIDHRLKSRTRPGHSKENPLPGEEGYDEWTEWTRESGYGDNVNTSGECSTAEKTVAADDIRDLIGQCTIHLGFSDELNMDLVASVPYGYMPANEKEEMLAEFLPQWFDNVGPLSESLSMVKKCIKYNDDLKIPGLFWDSGYGYYYKAIQYALATLYEYASLAEGPELFQDSCGITADSIREQIEDKKRWVDPKLSFCPTYGAEVRVESNGKVRPEYTGTTPVVDIDVSFEWCGFGPDCDTISIDFEASFLAMTPGDTIYLCDYLKMQAALADYYFWWAHRLHSYARVEGKATLTDYLVGMYCARCALSEIVEIAALIVHEFGHITGSKFHCYTGDKQFDCCQWVVQSIFRNRMLAKLGLPSPHFVTNSYYGPYQDRDLESTGSATIGNRLQFNASAYTWESIEGAFQERSGNDCGGALPYELTVRATHDSILRDIDRTVEIEWTLPGHNECSSDLSQTAGVEVYPETASSKASIPRRDGLDHEPEIDEGEHMEREDRYA